MRFKIFCAPGDHRDDFEAIQTQLNEWAAAEDPDIVDVCVQVTAMTDTKNIGRYLMSVLVTYRGPGE
ncbi:MAG: hypothetical protein KKB50_18710 [Planctomycetes bacterium]|nr:hypothetical protein [Planctomycetota bacterium]